VFPVFRFRRICSTPASCLLPASTSVTACFQLPAVFEKHLTLLCLLLTAGLLVAGLWPFNFWTQNHVSVVPGTGLKFDAPPEHTKWNLGGMAFTQKPVACRTLDDCQAGAVTILMQLQSNDDARSCVKEVLDIRRLDGSPAFIIGQWQSELIIRSFGPNAGKYREIGVDGTLVPGVKRTVAVTSGLEGTDIVIDGRPTQHFSRFRMLTANESLQGQKLYIANSPELGCPWAGSFSELVVLGSSWTHSALENFRWNDAGGRCSETPGAVACYDLGRMQGDTVPDQSGSGNGLSVPRHLAFDKRALALPDWESFSVSDLVVNILGFVPFGFLIYLRLLQSRSLRWDSSMLLAVIVGFVLSLAIELTQAWLPGRDSSMSDLIANTFGTAVGAAIGSTAGRGQAAVGRKS